MCFRDPLIPIDYWNVHNRVFEDLPRTTNSLEAWHRALGHSLPADHPSIWRLITVLKEELSLSIAHSAASQSESNGSQKGKYRNLTDELRRKQRELIEGDIGIIQFLNAVAPKFNFVN